MATEIKCLCVDIVIVNLDFVAISILHGINEVKADAGAEISYFERFMLAAA